MCEKHATQSVLPALVRQSQKYHFKFEATMNYTGKPYLKIEINNNQKI